MSRPICLLLSIAVQAVLFLPMRDIELDLSAADTPLLLTLALQVLDDARDPGGEAEANQPAKTPQPDLELANPKPARLHDLATETFPEPRSPATPEADVPLDRAVEASPRAALGPALAFEPAPNAITEPKVTMPMAQEQLRMLRGRFERLGEKLDELAPSERRVTWQHDGQEYIAVFTRRPARDSMSVDEVLVEVSTEKGGARLTSDLRMKRLAFSNFVQFVDQWDGDLRLHDDEFDGRFHSNEAIPIEQSEEAKPVFHSTVTTAEGIDTSESTERVRRSDIFLGGLQTRVRRIVLPKRFVPFPQDSRAEADVHELSVDTRITFHADGTYSWSSAGSPEQRRTLPEHPYYIVGAENAELSLKGVVNGKVLVYSRGKILIEDDLTYASDPLLVPEADDYLGLVSDGNVEIADPDTTGPGDLRVQAAIYATRQFVVRHHAARQDATLFIDGSLIAGYLSATEPRFRTKLQFDRRLEDLRPPAFPVTDRYEVADWNGLWTVEASGS